MKRHLPLWVLSLCLLLSGCGAAPTDPAESTPAPPVSEDTVIESAQESTAPVEPAYLEQQIRLRFDGGEAIVTLLDNPASRTLLEQLPLTQTFEDYNNLEKIARLAEELPTQGAPSGVDPAVGDITLYAPWNTLVFYYDEFGCDDSLIPVGRVESGMKLLAEMGDEFTVTMEVLSEVDPADAAQTEITMTAGDTVITATLSDSQTTREFLATLPRTFTMNRYGDRKYYGRMEAISEDGAAIADFTDGDVTFYPGGPSFAVFFAGENSSSQSGLIRMGRVTSELGVFDDLGETVELTVELSQ